jgi:3-isopropylmalate/(R)-2-methylmalate dehydratase small subunit
MTMEPFTTLTSTVAVLPQENVDTDQIIPARFLKTTVRTGLGAHLFADWRTDPTGRPRPDFVLNRPDTKGARILLAGRNFGCGSSREHAPWALLDYGFRAVISTYFADIFRNNAVTNGMLPVVLDAEHHATLMERCTADRSARVTIDLEAQKVTLPDGGEAHFPIDAFAKKCLLAGLDSLGFLLAESDRINEYERTHVARACTV